MAESGKLAIQDIYDKMTTGDIVSIKAKVIWKRDTEIVYSSSMRKELTKCEMVLTDSTGAITATVLEDTIPHVHDQKSYVLSNLKFGFFKIKCLNVTKDCRYRMQRYKMVSGKFGSIKAANAKAKRNARCYWPNCSS